MPYQPTLSSLNGLPAPLPSDLQNETFFLDPGAVESFDHWLQENPNHFNLLGSGWNVVISSEHKEQLKVTHPALFKPIRRGVENTRRELIPAFGSRPLPANDRWMINELLALVFNGEPRHTRRAELLALARRAYPDRTIYFISNCARFDRVPNCKTFHVPDSLEKDHAWPATFDPFADLELHEDVIKASQGLFLSGSLPKAIQSCALQLGEKIKIKTGDTVNKDYALAQYWFSCDKSRNPATRREPRHKINELYQPNGTEDDNSWNEALGYGYFCMGAMSALRNPTSHLTDNDPWIDARFNDKVRTLKWLAFLSILMEILDNPYRT